MNWVKNHQALLAGVFVGCTALGVLADLYLVLWLHVATISWRTWVAEQEHPTIAAAGVLTTVAVGWLVRRYWGLVLFAGLLGGHLFCHF
jgi:hypothetical protein